LVEDVMLFVVVELAMALGLWNGEGGETGK